MLEVLLVPNLKPLPTVLCTFNHISASQCMWSLFLVWVYVFFFCVPVYVCICCACACVCVHACANVFVLYVCACVCVRERERVRVRETVCMYMYFDGAAASCAGGSEAWWIHGFNSDSMLFGTEAYMV